MDEVSGGVHSTHSNSDYSGGAYTEFISNFQGAVTYGFSVDASGDYNLRVRVRTGPDRGVYQVSIATDPGGDFIPLNSSQDFYTPSESFRVINLGNVHFPDAGPKQLRFTRVGQNSNNSFPPKTISFALPAPRAMPIPFLTAKVASLSHSITT